MRVHVSFDCRAVVTSEQQVRCSPANGNAGLDFLTRNWIADGSTHRRKGKFPTLLQRHCVCRGSFSTHDRWACGALAKRIQNRDRTYFLPSLHGGKRKSP